MAHAVDDHFVDEVLRWEAAPELASARADPTASQVGPDRLMSVFEAQLESRHLDFAARWLHGEGEGFYTIGSAGHEANALVASALRPTDPALLHYRSGGFYAARARQVHGASPLADVLHSLTASVHDPISGGRHKVFGHPDLSIIPQTSTIGSHLPRAMGLAFSLPRAHQLGASVPWPRDALVVASFGDASANHSTTQGALNAASFIARHHLPIPLLLVCEDNGIGISTPTPRGWLESALSRFPSISYHRADGAAPAEALLTLDRVAHKVRTSRRPAVVHLRTVRFMGHAGSDAELAYRTPTAIAADHDRDPLLAMAATLVATGQLTPIEVLQRYEGTRHAVMESAAGVRGTERLSTADDVMAPLTARRARAVRLGAAAMPRTTDDADPVAAMTLAQSITATLEAVMTARPHSVLFGEDVAVKGGVYGLTRGLRKRFGPARVFDSILDEQTILGTALGAALTGLLPIPEIQYLAYVHNAEDQLRGEAASLRFFSAGQHANGMVVRIAGLAYQKGFGGHFHNDNSVAVLRDVPGLALAVPSHPADAPELLQTCVALAEEEGRVCVFLEPIALYHQRDLHPGDAAWTAPYVAASADREAFGAARLHGDGSDLLMVTFGNGVHLARLAADRLESDLGVRCSVLDLRWLAPLPEADLAAHAARFDRVLVVDETRRSGGVGEAVVAALVDAGQRGRIGRVTSRDSYVPLGPAAAAVLLSADDVIAGAVDLLGMNGAQG
jgi:2-oxoisovalerate dehydrogenase E1 component